MEKIKQCTDFLDYPLTYREVYILKRLDCGLYYQGSYRSNIAARWSPKLSKAKRYKRSCDAANALTCMRDSTYATKQFPWLNKPGNFVIESYQMTKVGERVL